MIIESELKSHIELSVDLIYKSEQLNVRDRYFLKILFEILREKNYSSNKLKFKFNDLYEHFKETRGVELTIRDFEKLINSIQSKIPCIFTQDGFVRTIWYTSIWNPLTEEISFIFEDRMLNHIKDAYDNPKTIKLETLYVFRGLYSVKLYTLLKKCMTSDKIIEISIDSFKDVMSLAQRSGYKNFTNLNLNVLEPAIDEINKKSEIKISCEPVRKGNKVESLRFKILN